jgi:adenine-specific DNA methylase
VADTFCGSGQIPFEAARLGCDVYASDLNPVACMLTWGAFNIVGRLSWRAPEAGGGSKELIRQVQTEIDKRFESRPMARDGEPKHFSIVLKPAAHSPVGWCRCYRPS